MASKRPISTDVLTAFGVDADAPLKALPGGTLVCYLAGDNGCCARLKMMLNHSKSLKF